MKRVLCLFLLFVLIVMPLVSCDKGDDQNNNNNPPSDGDTVIDFGGDDYIILAREETIYEVDDSGEGTDDKVQRKIWERNVTMKDMYNVNVKSVPCPGIYKNRAQYIAAARESINSGMDEYDLFFTHSSYMQLLAMEGMGIELSKLPQINAEAAWWCKDYNDISTIDNKSYVLVGDMGITLYEYLEVVFFNEELATEHQIEDLYQKVLDGKWTLDEMMRLSKLVMTDTNSQLPEDERTYGLLSNAHAAASWVASLNLRYTVKGEGEQRTFGRKPPQKLADTFDTIRIWYMGDSVRYGTFSATDFEESNPIFADGRALFYTQMLGEAKYFAANMEKEYGVLPFPKLEEGEKTWYRTTTRDSISSCMVPASVQNLELAGTITEAMCKYGRENITYEYFETRLKLRYFDDYQTKAMLDIIRDGLSYEFTEVFGDAMTTSPYDSFGTVISRNVVSPNSETLAFHWQGNAGTWIKELKMMYENFAKLDQ